MEKLSRVKKYEKLRESIDGNDVEEFNSLIDVKKINDNNKSNKFYEPSHEKNVTLNVEKNKPNDTGSTGDFKNEYLDSFIQEVRDYNIQKGTREHEDTKLDILAQLNAKNREKRSRYIEETEKNNVLDNDDSKNIIDDQDYNTKEISKQVFDLLKDDSTNDIEKNNDTSNQSTLVDKKQSLEDRIAMLESQIVEPTFKDTQTKVVNEIENDVQNSDEAELSKLTKEKLLEETTKLKVQMDEYKDELNDLNTGIDSNNRLLNIIITVLIIALLAVIGVVVYWLISGGII